MTASPVPRHALPVLVLAQFAGTCLAGWLPGLAIGPALGLWALRPLLAEERAADQPLASRKSGGSGSTVVFTCISSGLSCSVKPSIEPMLWRSRRATGSDIR